MTNENLGKLKVKAGEMAVNNIWGEKSYQINMKILEGDINNFAAYTRLAKYHRLSDNINDAEKMYLKALEINPNSQGVKNNLNEIERYHMETKFIDDLTTSKELCNSGLKLTQKGSYRLAMKCYLKAYSIEPVIKNGVSLAKSYNKLGDYNKIKDLYKELMDNNSLPDVVKYIKDIFEEILNGKKCVESM
jgi:pentatricopeptide repeat protein